MTLRAGAWLSLLLPLAAAGDPGETLLGCRKLSDAAERLACYDRVVDRAAQTIEPEVLATAPRASSSEPERSLRERLFGRSVEETDRALRDAYGVQTAAELTAVATAVKRGPDGRVVVTLDNGQVWRQTESRAFPLREGQTVRVREGALGSFYMNPVDGGRTAPVQRVR
ncbi:MAG: hypothetical protein FJ091_20795 [Deltaproteobacteria bacterium]|nr:hypothetical protein [Deltaproteobacteria bacterium]